MFRTSLYAFAQPQAFFVKRVKKSDDFLTKKRIIVCKTKGDNPKWWRQFVFITQRCLTVTP